MPPLISVVIPNRNGEKTIGPCLAAVLASGYQEMTLSLEKIASMTAS